MFRRSRGKTAKMWLLPSTNKTKQQQQRRTSRLLSEAVKKMVAARQKWQCSECQLLLPGSFQVDHTVPLCDGGADTEDNVTAMCPTCHAEKTQAEHVQRTYASKSNAEQYEERQDFFSGEFAMCELCNAVRPKHAPHDMCVAIEDPNYRLRGIASSMAKFAYVPRV